MYDHGITNGISDSEILRIVSLFAEHYVETMISYVGNQVADLLEVTHRNTKGLLGNFLKSTNARSSAHRTLEKFTRVGESGRKFIFDSVDNTVGETIKPTLRRVNSDVRDEITRAWGIFGYGATISKIGWMDKAWSDDFYRIIDIAQRVHSGDGSYGNPRYYVLIAGRETDSGDQDETDSYDQNENETSSDSAIILDIKFCEPPAMRYVLRPEQLAWYSNQFVNEASRQVEAQKRLTSYTDPFVGWIYLGGTPYVVRERSPWKASFDVDMLKNVSDFEEFAKQIGMITATAHARGSAGRSPAQIKDVIAYALGSKESRKAWASSVANVASAYRTQILLDFHCFKSWVDAEWKNANFSE